MVTRFSTSSSLVHTVSSPFNSQWTALEDQAKALIAKSSSSFEVHDISALIEEMQITLNAFNIYVEQNTHDQTPLNYINTLHHLLEALRIKQISIDLFNRNSPTSLPFTVLEMSQDFINGSSYTEPEKKLGEGCFGVVHKVTLNERCLAQKTVLPLKDSFFHHPDKLKREAALLMALKHNNVISIAGFVSTPVNTLFLHYANRGSLYDNLHHPELYTHKNILHILKGVATGLNYLHKHNLTHCDLHWGNIGLHQAIDTIHPKILDFELASLKTPMSATEGNILIQSPEALRSNPTLHHRACKNLRYQTTYPHVSITDGKKCYFKSELTQKTDIWSFGMIAFSILSGGRNLYSLQNIEMENYLLKSLRFSSVIYLKTALASAHFPRLGLHPNHPLCTSLCNQVVAPCFERDFLSRPTADKLMLTLAKIECLELIKNR